MTTLTTPSSSQQLWQYETPAVGGIVVGFDGSFASRAAIESAAAIAAARKWPVHVISVLRPMSTYELDPGKETPSQVEALRIQLRDAALRDAIGSMYERADWTHEVSVGTVTEEIVKAAERRGADLIMVGRTERGTIDRLLHGERTLQLMRCSSVPVLVVGQEIESPRTIVVAVDFGPASARAAALAVEMVGDSGTIYLVYVEPPLGILADGMFVPELQGYPGDVLVRFRQITSRLRAHSSVIIETVMLNGASAPAILEFCERVGADVLAVGTHGLRGIQRFLLGSVSTALVRDSSIPILVCPSDS